MDFYDYPPAPAPVVTRGGYGAGLGAGNYIGREAPIVVGGREPYLTREPAYYPPMEGGMVGGAVPYERFEEPPLTIQGDVGMPIVGRPAFPFDDMPYGPGPVPPPVEELVERNPTVGNPRYYYHDVTEGGVTHIPEGPTGRFRAPAPGQRLPFPHLDPGASRNRRGSKKRRSHKKKRFPDESFRPAGWEEYGSGDYGSSVSGGEWEEDPRPFAPEPQLSPMASHQDSPQHDPLRIKTRKGYNTAAGATALGAAAGAGAVAHHHHHHQQPSPTHLPQGHPGGAPNNGTNRFAQAGKMTVGPVIGLALHDRVRILVEVPEAGSVTMFLYDTQSRQAVAQQTRKVYANIPHVFEFSGLQPRTRYTVSVPSHKHPSSGFRTLPQHPTLQDNLKFGIIACNKIRTTNEVVKEHSCVWKALAAQCERGDLDMNLHLGDQVYGDDDFEAMEQGKVKKEDAIGHCAFMQAKDLVESTPHNEWPAIKERVCEIYRDVYRETWGHHWTALALANCPNIMQYDDHEIRDDLGDKPEELDRSSVTYFICEAARRTILEYQRALYEHIDLSNPHVEPVLDDENHFHLSLGEYGILFCDTRGAKVFKRVENDPYPFMTSKQWQDTDRALAPGGKFDQCKVLLFATQIPIVFFSKYYTEMVAKGADDFEGMWAYKDNIKEQTRMLNALEQWKYRQGGRGVVLAGGDVHLGGYTEIFHHKRYLGRQIIVGPVSNTTISGVVKKSTEFIKERGEALHEDWTFEHWDWIYERNYGIIEITPQYKSEAEPFTINLTHIVGNNDKNPPIRLVSANKGVKVAGESKKGNCSVM